MAALPSGATPAPPRPAPPPLDGLPRRQRQVCDLLLAGKTDREIAEALGLAIQTVKNYATAAYAKLGIGDPHNGRACQGRIGLARLYVEEARAKGRDVGYATGYRHGYVDGLEKGRKEGRAAALREIDHRCSVCPVR
jgi:DNA-binding CsgD family transcriptional regulator